MDGNPSVPQSPRPSPIVSPRNSSFGAISNATPVAAVVLCKSMMKSWTDEASRRRDVGAIKTYSMWLWVKNPERERERARDPNHW